MAGRVRLTPAGVGNGRGDQIRSVNQKIRFSALLQKHLSKNPMIPNSEQRVVVTGVPRSGKTTLADKSFGSAMHSDDLVGHEWSEQSRIVADDWFSRPGPWVIEGVTAVRALRKWLAAHPDGKPCDVVYWSGQPKAETTKAQDAMGLGHSRMFDDLRGELVRRGCEITYF